MTASRTVRALGLGLSVAALAQGGCNPHDARALDVLRQVDAAVRAVKTVRYHVIYEPLGAAADEIPTVEGDMIMSGWANGSPDQFRSNAQYKVPSTGQVAKVTLGRTDGRYYVVDHGLKTVHIGETAAVFGSYGPVARSVLMVEFVHPSPFSEELSADEQKLRGSETVDGQACHEVRIVYANKREAIWRFAKNDLLPRQVHRLDREKGVEGRQTVTQLTVDPPSSDDPFRLESPPDYRVSTETAP